MSSNLNSDNNSNKNNNNENQNNTQHLVNKLSKENELTTNYPEVLKMIIDMALETENKTLDPEIIKKSINVVINNKALGYYAVAIVENNKDILTYKGMNQMTYEFNILTNKRSFWLQSVMVKKEFRKKGVFKALVNFSENLVKEDLNNNNNCLKLYVDGDNKNAQNVYFNMGFTSNNQIIYERDFVFDKINWEEINSNFNCFEIIEFSDKDIFDKFKLNEIIFKDFCNNVEYTNFGSGNIEKYKNILFIFMKI